MFRARRTSIVLASSVAMVFAGGGSSLIATGSPGTPVDDAEPALAGDALSRAAGAALAVTGGGRVTDSEADDEESFYEVEVTLHDGREVDVQLNRAFRVVSRSHDAWRDDGQAAG